MLWLESVMWTFLSAKELEGTVLPGAQKGQVDLALLSTGSVCGAYSGSGVRLALDSPCLKLEDSRTKLSEFRRKIVSWRIVYLVKPSVKCKGRELTFSEEQSHKAFTFYSSISGNYQKICYTKMRE